MKKLTRKINFVLVGAMLSAAPVVAMAAESTGVDEKRICDLIISLGSLLRTIRVLAFIGAGFVIARWAWDWIKAGDVKMDEVRDKGVGLLVGFTLLFMIGVVLSFLMSNAGGKMIGCAADAFENW